MVIFLFWLGVMVLTLLALGLLLPPLLRGQDDRPRQRREIERGLAELKRRHGAGEIDEATHAGERERLSKALVDVIESDAPQAAPAAKNLALVLALVLPLSALLLYFSLGRPDALDFRDDPRAAHGDGRDMSMQMDQAVAALEQRLREQPDNVEGWLLLARSYRAMERFDDMMRATSSAMTLAPDTPQVLVEHAEATALSGANRRLVGEARQLLDRALEIDPEQHKALWLLGVSEYQQERYPEAVVVWQRLRSLLTADDPIIASLEQQIAEARARTTDVDGDAMAGTGNGDAPILPAADSDDGPGIQVTVELAEDLQAQRQTGDTLFVFARAPDGGPPLAIQRLDNPRFPVEVRLSQADRMLDGLQIETGQPVSISARLSRSGQAQPQSGDLEAESIALTPEGDDRVGLRIDRAVP